MNGYILRNVSDDLWEKAKHICIDDKITMRELITSALSDYVDKINKKAKTKEKSK